MKVHPITDPALGNRSYLVELDGGAAVAVDPRRDVDEILSVAERAGREVVTSLETHLHADFVTGSPELASATGARVVAAGAARVATPHVSVQPGDLVELGGASFQALSTPGHTPEHVAYVLRTGERTVGVFSGGSLIAGGAARTDLVTPAQTEELARAQFASIRRLAELPDDVVLWPTHGAGSFCSTGPAATGDTTIGEQRRLNPLLGIDDEDEFVRHVLAGYGTFPSYFLELRAVNRAGPALVAELDQPRPLTPPEAAALVDEGAWLVDARPPTEWAARHPAGAVSNALRPAFASWLGWVVPFGAPVVFLIDEPGLGDALRLARRIGYDRVEGWLDGGVEAWEAAGLPVESAEEIDAEEAAERWGSGVPLVDVRQRPELDAVRVPGAVHLELGAIAAGKSLDGEAAVVFCGHGERSATAASLLEGRGVRSATVRGGIGAWEAAGLPVER